MPGPPKQFDRDAALMKSMDLFWRQGFEATSIEDLVNAVGINRSSMYSTFGDKRALFLEALRLYSDFHIAQLTEALGGRGKPLNRLKRALRLIGKQTQDDGYRGCFAGNTAAELGVENPEAAEIVRATMNRALRALKGVLDEAVEAEELDAKTNTADLAAFIMTFVQGVHVTSQVTCAAGQVNQLIESLIVAVKSGDWS